MRIALFGAGRIGRIHGINISQEPNCQLQWVIDPSEDCARDLARIGGAQYSTDPDSAFSDTSVEAIFICSPTPTHYPLIQEAVSRKLPIFVEKPISLSLKESQDCSSLLDESGVPCMLGFNRRFDPTFAALWQEARGGSIGPVESIIIISRDPAPPSNDYLKHSGGLFRDMMIHDLDMARWLAQEEPEELQVTASCLVDPSISLLGDVDTALVSLRFPSGKICSIHNSRRSGYGYDQRIEVHGRGGLLSSENPQPKMVQHHGRKGCVSAPIHYNFPDRYQEAYRLELRHFIQCIQQGRSPTPNAHDGLKALELANWAETQFKNRAQICQKLK